MSDATWGAIVRDLACRHGDREAIVDGAVRVSFAQLDRRTDLLAALLSARGVGPGDRLATLLPDGYVLVEVLLAAAKLGVIAVPLNWRLAGPELEFAIQHCEPSLWFVSSRFGELARAAAPALARIDVPDTDHAVDYTSLLPGEPGNSVGAPCASDPWIMLYTSGTTGRPKGCLLTHGGWSAGAEALRDWLGLRPEDRRLSSSPLFHSGGLGLLIAYLLAGAATVIMPRGAGAADLLDLIDRERCTCASIPVTLMGAVLDEAERSGRPHSLRIVTGGGGMHDRVHIERVRSALGAELALGYGQTEACGYAGMISGQEQIDHPRATTRLFPGMEGCVVGDAGEALGPNEPGELRLRGSQAMSGYWRDPDATAVATAGGWLRTGDLFQRGTGGYLQFVGRSKELIKSGGENVYPREVEQVMLTHPAVRDCAVTGVADVKWGEAVKAFIVPKAGIHVTAAELVAWCRRSIAGYKRPRYVQFIDAVPRTPLGKIDMTALRSMPLEPGQAVD